MLFFFFFFLRLQPSYAPYRRWDPSLSVKACHTSQWIIYCLTTNAAEEGLFLEEKWDSKNQILLSLPPPWSGTFCLLIILTIYLSLAFLTTLSCSSPSLPLIHSFPPPHSHLCFFLTDVGHWFPLSSLPLAPAFSLFSYSLAIIFHALVCLLFSSSHPPTAFCSCSSSAFAIFFFLIPTCLYIRAQVFRKLKTYRYRELCLTCNSFLCSWHLF